MKVFSEETRVFYSDAFPHALAVTSLGNTSLAGVKVHAVMRAPQLDRPEDEARRALRLTCWLARFGNLWPPFVGMSEFGPFPFPLPTNPGSFLTPEEMARVAVEAAGAADNDVPRAFERAMRGPFRHRFHYDFENTVRADPELEQTLRELRIPIACSPLRDMTLGELFEHMKGLYIIRRFGPGAVEAATAIQAARLIFEGELMMMLATVVAGTTASVVLRVLKPAESFSDAFSREIAATTGGSPQIAPSPDAPALPDSTSRRGRRRKGPSTEDEGSQPGEPVTPTS